MDATPPVPCVSSVRTFRIACAARRCEGHSVGGWVLCEDVFRALAAAVEPAGSLLLCIPSKRGHSTARTPPLTQRGWWLSWRRRWPWQVAHGARGWCRRKNAVRVDSPDSELCAGLVLSGDAIGDIGVELPMQEGVEQRVLIVGGSEQRSQATEGVWASTCGSHTEQRTEQRAHGARRACVAGQRGRRGGL